MIILFHSERRLMGEISSAVWRVNHGRMRRSHINVVKSFHTSVFIEIRTQDNERYSLLKTYHPFVDLSYVLREIESEINSILFAHVAETFRMTRRDFAHPAVSELSDICKEADRLIEENMEQDVISKFFQ